MQRYWAAACTLGEMALLSTVVPDYDDICTEDYTDNYTTYDELTDGMSVCSGSVNDILDRLNDDELRNSGDLDTLDLDEVTIPDIINFQSAKSNCKPKFGSGKTFANSFSGQTKLGGGDSSDMLHEYMGKVLERDQREKERQLYLSEPKKFVELADKSGDSNCILSEFMQMRGTKFNETNENRRSSNTSAQSIRSLSNSNGKADYL